jgi:hypothetical protein
LLGHFGRFKFPNVVVKISILEPGERKMLTAIYCGIDSGIIGRADRQKTTWSINRESVLGIIANDYRPTYRMRWVKLVTKELKKPARLT